MGVWIETYKRIFGCLKEFVTPRVGVWIETLLWYVYPVYDIVTPRVGVWIETLTAARRLPAARSHSPRGSVD